MYPSTIIFLHCFLNIDYKCCFKTIGHFPSLWKISKVIPVLKSGKNPTLLTSYRPITLLHQLSKVAEKIIKNRICAFLKDNKIITKEQFGFREGDSTTGQLARLVNEVTDKFNKKMHTGEVLLDVEKAFDTVWHNGLIYKLIKYNFPRYLVLLINS